ncbi:MAG: T9SS type A sorting domain-containing protein [Candidatus Marinimicrobia bacterium]|nr:T9SS type A sorting domain-containing protein [Candidatus Neomarinimicrobiota bacterium]
MSKRLIVVSITAMMLLFAPALSAQVEVMADPSFELQTAATLDGEMWFNDGDNLIITVGLDDGEAHTGANSVIITANADWTGIGTIVELVPETEYTLSLWVKGDDIGVSGTFGFWDEAVDDGFEPDDFNVNSEDWKELTLTFTTFASTDALVEYGFWFGSYEGTDGAVFRVDDISLMATAVTAVDANGAMPAAYALGQNYPNPFNPNTTIDFTLNAAGAVILDVYDLMGHKVRTLADAPMSSGTHSVKWNGRDDSGNQLSSGIYIYRMSAGSNTYMKKMMLLK